ncbi:BMC domain-containing protein [Anaerococcus porci]|uniref:BMC domain-containing protein n=1 Tax=Anaerococcus porci TaxID=2652269 RepID=UPI002A753D5F|nr:BMC domain-containing protein [Anaerococcus porci]MDY3007284.1 BMC domain-containing protein [Anaerococcus porci]
MENLQRIVQESVPGKQITLLHLISSPDSQVNEKIGLDKGNAIGIMTLTPTESSIIAADVASKAACVEICFIDRFNGCVLLQGDNESVRQSLEAVKDTFERMLKFISSPVTIS